jgi:GDP-4-dehydro-6-deoxy-D-mannose reductase
MNVLITGIEGFVGGHLTRALQQIPSVRISGTIISPSFAAFLPPGVVAYPTDITKFDSLRDTLSKARPEKIFHLAGQAFVPHSVKNPADTFNTNVMGTVNLLEAVRQDAALKSCSVLVISSGEVYGKAAPEMIPIREEVPLQPNNPYAASKAAADLIAQQYRNSFGMSVIVARPFNHLGPGQSELFVGSAFAKQVAEIKAGKREPKLHVGNLEPKRDFTDVRDVVRAYIHLLEQPRPDAVYNVCSERPLAVKEILSTLLELSGLKVDVVPDSERMRANEVPLITGSAARLRAATGWKPEIPIRKTLGDLLAYWEHKIAHPQ